MRGRIILVGIVVLALGGAGLIGTAENAMANNAVTQIANNGCQCEGGNATPSAPNTIMIPAYLLYGLLAIGAVLLIVGLVAKKSVQVAT